VLRKNLRTSSSENQADGGRRFPCCCAPPTSPMRRVLIRPLPLPVCLRQTPEGVLARKPGSKPLQIDRDSARRVHRALGELRTRGQERDWLAALVDYLHDTRDRRSESVCRGSRSLLAASLSLPELRRPVGGTNPGASSSRPVPLSHGQGR